MNGRRIFVGSLVLLFISSGCAFFQPSSEALLDSKDLDIVAELLENTIHKKVREEEGETKSLEIESVVLHPENENQVRISYSVLYELPGVEGQPDAEVLFSAVVTLEAEKETGKPTVWDVLHTEQREHSYEFLSPETVEVSL